MSSVNNSISIQRVLKRFPMIISVTWTLVVLENIFIALVPLFIGLAIDGLLLQTWTDFLILSGMLVAIIGIAMFRQFVDTRGYTIIKRELSIEIEQAYRHHPLSLRVARVQMVDSVTSFLEQELPPLLSAVTQVITALTLLTYFYWPLGVAAVITAALVLAMYAANHSTFTKLYRALNTFHEQQLKVLRYNWSKTFKAYLNQKRKIEVEKSDLEAGVYGAIFFIQFGFVVVCLVLTAKLPEISAGQIFAIVSYAWDFVEGFVALPIVLQSYSHVEDVMRRFNQQELKPTTENDSPN